MKLIPEATRPWGHGTDAGNLVHAVLRWSDGLRPRNCAARLVEVREHEAEFLVFGDPPEGAKVRIIFVAPAGGASGTVVRRGTGAAGSGPRSARVAVHGKGWRRFASRFHPRRSVHWPRPAARR
jgi:hypothetical protein